MSVNESIEEIVLDPSAPPVQSTEENASQTSETLVPDDNVNPPQTSVEKVAEWIKQSGNMEDMSSVGKEETDHTIVDAEQEDEKTPMNTTETALGAHEISGQDVATNDSQTVTTDYGSPTGSRSILHRLYHAQPNPSTEHHMRALTAHKVWSRDLRRVASASTEPNSLPIIEFVE